MLRCAVLTRVNPPAVFSTELRLALAPASTYRELTARKATGSWLVAFERPAFTALLIGALVAIASTGRVALGLVSSLTVCWSFVPALQMVAGAIVIASSRSRSSPMPRALALLFAGHVPWSLWTLVAAAWVASVPFVTEGQLGLSLLVPAAWTAYIVFAFCRTVLGVTARGAALRTAAHQAIVWTIAGTYVFLTTGMWPRLLGALGR